ncbi:S9 family peptidase [Massilia sp. NR 4-1]|uniref:S9 family peptidase n=1 Tax=Massilia sp. NR 4-1 TaxID=1678028 RepID=UPI000A7CB02F|nr:S9 family peptidase [Massilia sp. NR 4-1]
MKIVKASTLTPVLASALAIMAAPALALDAPVAAKRAWQETRHGEVVTDDYYWLREKSTPAVIDYLKAENAYTESMTANIKPLADKVFAEMKGRMLDAEQGAPLRSKGYYYYTRIEAGQQYASNYRRRAGADHAYDPKAPEELLLDRNKLAKGKKFFAVEGFAVSPDTRLLAYTTDTTGFRQYQLHIKDLKTGKLLSTTMPRITSLAWASDNKTLFVVQEDATTKRSDRLFRLPLGGKPTQLRHEADELYNIGVETSSDGKYLLLGAHSTDTNETRLLPADQPKGEFKVLLPREKGHRYFADMRDGQAYLMTNKEAKNFRIVSAPLATPQPQHWTEVVAHDKDVLLQGFSLYQNFLVVQEKSRALPRTRIYDFAARDWKTVQFPDEVYAADTLGSAPGSVPPDFNSRELVLRYESPVAPPTVLGIDMASGQRREIWRKTVPGYDAGKYETRMLWATARDGVQVPLWTLAKKGVARDGKAPLLLYAYGSYGMGMNATFSARNLSLVDRGAVYVMAYIRGGNELGEAWHDDGMLMKKKNTFTDFIDVADYLVKEKWTSPDRLIAEGGSAGGLLMGAVANMRPELFRGVHAAVPFVDVMNTMMDASLPLTTGEYLEWGNPNEKAAYDYMRSYSPYDNIERKAYPAMLVTTGLNDSQVMYWEPAKYVAKLRAHKTDKQPLLLKVNMGAGHGGASGRYDALHEQAFQRAWMLSLWGITE